MACGSPYHWGQNHKATEATTCEMPENQEKTPCSKLTKRNPDPKLNSDTTPASDAQTQRPEMTGNDREIKISKLNSDTTPASDAQTQRPEMAASGREIKISKPNSDTSPASDAQTQRPEMTGNDREIKISELTFRQQAALPRIALAQAQAARDAGVAESTLRRWLQDPSFRQEFDRHRQELDRLRQESYDLARQAMRGLGQLWHRANPYGSLRSVIPAKAGIQG